MNESIQRLKVQAADGKWDWTNPYWRFNHWGTSPTDSVPVYQRGLPNRSSGYFDKDEIPHTKNGVSYIFSWLDEETGVERGLAERHKGIGNSFWSYDRYNVFSPKSNPPSQANIGVYVTGEDAYGNITATIYTSTPYSSPPARPYLIKLENHSSGGNQGIKLTWSANLEPDLAGYEVFRQIADGSITKISGGSLVTDTTWVHWGVIIASSGSDYTYYVKAVDNQNKKSNFSNGLHTTVQSVSQGGEDKIIASGNDMESSFPKAYELENNYPNPFNPTTTIQFGLPEKSQVQITVYNIAGELVTTLINSEYPAGYHRVIFNASQLASGIYLYRIEAGKFTQVHKMMLLK